MNIFSKIFKKKSKKVTLILNGKGKSFVGGKAGSEIEMPALETSPMVYFGCVSKEETQFESINFDLHLICPLFIDLTEAVFLDYSNPYKPKLIRENVSSNFEQLFEDIPNTAYIEYKKLNFIFDNPAPTKVKIGAHDIEMIPGEIGHCGTPNWIQNDAWPNCPITGKKMQFLFQLGDIDDSTTIKGQDILEKEYFDPYLNFGHGYLYVFYAPESQVVAYINQFS